MPDPTPGIVTSILQIGHGDDAVLVFRGGDAGGQDLVLRIGGGATRDVTLKRDATLIDTLDHLDGLSIIDQYILAESFGLSTSMLSSSVALPDNTTLFVMLNLPQKQIVDGIRFVQHTQGVYTADASNQVGLYEFDAVNQAMERIAISTSDGNLWKSAAGTWGQVTFSSALVLEPKTYWVALLYNNSAQTTAPRICAAPDVSHAKVSEPAGGRFTYATHAGDGSLPSSVATSSMTASVLRPWVALLQQSIS